MALQSVHKDYTLAPRASGRLSWLETLLVTAAALGLGFWLVPEDPLMVGLAFPWVVFAPILMGVRYGFMRGLVSAALLVVALLYLHRQGYPAYEEIPPSFIVGVLLSAMLVGEFRDLWDRRLERLDLANDYRQLRLDEFTRAHHLLRISHDRLEQRVAGNDLSLRSSLLDLRRQLREVPREQDALKALAEPIVGLLAQYGSLRVAGLYRVDGNGRVDRRALASQGEMPGIDPDDLLVRLTLERGETLSIRQALLERGETQHSALQACVPLLDTEERLLAVLAIEQMPFFSFNERTLNLLTILAGHIADLLGSDPQALALADDDAQQFSQHLKRSLRDAQQHALPACLFCFEMTEADGGERALALLEGSRRGLDLQLRLTNQAGHPCLLVLLPLTSSDGLEGYRRRLRQLLAERHGQDSTLESLGVRSHEHELLPKTRAQELRVFLFNECGLHEQQVAV